MFKLIALLFLLPMMCAAEWQIDVESIVEYPRGEKRHMGLIVKYMVSEHNIALARTQGETYDGIGIVCEYRPMDNSGQLYIELVSERGRYPFGKTLKENVVITNELGQKFELPIVSESTHYARSDALQAFTSFVKRSKTIKVYDHTFNVQQFDDMNEALLCPIQG